MTSRGPASPRPPAAPRIDGPLTSLPGLPTDDELIADADLSGSEWTGAQLDGVDLSGCRGRSLSAPQCDWDHSQWSDVVLESSDLAASAWRDSGWQRAELCECRLTGVILSGCSLEDVSFRGCVLDMAQFRQARLRRVRFSGCRLAGADFSSALLEEVRFTDCVLDGARLHQVRITGGPRTGRRGPGLVISGGSIDGLSGADQLRGAAIDPIHLEVLGRLLATEAGICLQIPG